MSGSWARVGGRLLVSDEQGQEPRFSVARPRVTYSLPARCPAAHLGQLLPSLSGHLPILLTVRLVSQEKDDHVIRFCILHTEHVPSATRVGHLL